MINVSMKYIDNIWVSNFFDNFVWIDVICNLFVIWIEKFVFS